MWTRSQGLMLVLAGAQLHGLHSTQSGSNIQWE